LVARNVVLSRDDAALFSFQIQGDSLLERVTLSDNFFPNASLMFATDSTRLCGIECRFHGSYGRTMFFIDDGSRGFFSATTIEGNCGAILRGYSADDILFDACDIAGNSAGEASIFTIWRSPLNMFGTGKLVNNSGSCFAEFRERRGPLLLGGCQYNWNKFTECRFAFQFPSVSDFVSISATNNSGTFIRGIGLVIRMKRMRVERLNGRVVQCHNCTAAIHLSMFIDSVCEIDPGFHDPSSVKSSQFIGSEPPFDPPLDAFMTAVRVSGHTPQRCLFCEGGVWDEGIRDLRLLMLSECLGLGIVCAAVYVTWRSPAAFVRFLIFG
jgi:hypothetical protein